MFNLTMEAIMTSLMRFEPLFSEPFEDFFKRVMRPARWEVEAAPMDIKLDVAETEEAYTVKAEMPGMKKDDIHVEIDGNVVAISAESKAEKKVEEKGKMIRSERYYGSLYRSFTLGHEIDEAAADAKYVDGILELTLPKRATSRVKTVSVH